MFRGGSPLVIVYTIIQEKLYSAKKGQGAYCNSEEISVSGQTELKKALVFSEFGSHRDPKKLEIKFGNMYNIIMKSHGIRAQGSAALDLCGVACGQADAFVEYGIHVWDIAAGILIATEAGATVMDPNNGGKLDMMNRRILCASSRSLAHQLRSQIKSQEFIPD
ncbi:inositol monophosphatase 1-like [Octopus sinensis]|uniref:inositol-phosphate phosphatase n=1 Tax=Octopus sinensis TaxID=2607531 RepID=A0A7E6FGI9_9MOLL|nr:inositol monophosphatase 1-like [Octopus sinensis]